MSFRQARLRSAMTPPVRERAVAADEDFFAGALLIVNEDDEWEECGANPDEVAAIALSDYRDDPGGVAALGRHGFPPGRMQGMSVAKRQHFHASFLGDLPATAGGQYGVTRDTDGLWKVDFAKTGAAARVVLDKLMDETPIGRNRVIVYFIEEFVQAGVPTGV